MCFVAKRFLLCQNLVRRTLARRHEETNQRSQPIHSILIKQDFQVNALDKKSSSNKTIQSHSSCGRICVLPHLELALDLVALRLERGGAHERLVLRLARRVALPAQVRARLLLRLRNSNTSVFTHNSTEQWHRLQHLRTRCGRHSRTPKIKDLQEPVDVAGFWRCLLLANTSPGSEYCVILRRILSVSPYRK